MARLKPTIDGLNCGAVVCLIMVYAIYCEDIYHLSKDVNTSLEVALNAALAQLNSNNHIRACDQLNAFLNQVNAKQNSGTFHPAPKGSGLSCPTETASS